jgi:hypothetical protein
LPPPHIVSLFRSFLLPFCQSLFFSCVCSYRINYFLYLATLRCSTYPPCIPTFFFFIVSDISFVSVFLFTS